MSDNIIAEIKKIMINFSLYTAALIIGPLIFFGGIGLLLDIYFQSKPIILIVCVLIAFVFSNVVIFKKVQDLNKIIKNKAESFKKVNNKDET